MNESPALNEPLPTTLTKYQLGWEIGTTISAALIQGHGHHLDYAIDRAFFDEEQVQDIYKILFKVIGQEPPENPSKSPISLLFNVINIKHNESGSELGGALSNLLTHDELERLNGYTQTIADSAFKLTLEDQ